MLCKGGGSHVSPFRLHSQKFLVKTSSAGFCPVLFETESLNVARTVLEFAG